MNICGELFQNYFKDLSDMEQALVIKIQISEGKQLI